MITLESRIGFDPASLKKGATWSLKQSDDHRRLLRRLEGRVQTSEGKTILTWLDVCTQMQPNGRRLTCNQPMCRTCGLKAKEKLGAERADKIRGLQKVYGRDHVSAITINAEPCSLGKVMHAYSEFRKAITQCVRKNRLGHLDGEFEVILKEMMSADRYFGELDRLMNEREDEFDPATVIRVISRFWNPTRTAIGSNRLQKLRATYIDQMKSKALATCGNNLPSKLLSLFDPEMEDFFNPQPKTTTWLDDALAQKVGTRLITTEGRLMIHLHGFLVHPEHSRDDVKRIFEERFAVAPAIHVVPIEDKHRYGRVLDGAETYANYFTDKSGAVKGNLRINCDPREQALIFDAYATMSKGTRRRPSIRIGKLAVSAVNQEVNGDTALVHGLSGEDKAVFDPLRSRHRPAPLGDGSDPSPLPARASKSVPPLAATGLSIVARFRARRGLTSEP